MRRLFAAAVRWAAMICLAAGIAFPVFYWRWQPSFSYFGENAWKYRYLCDYELHGGFMQTHLPHPTRGWTLKPGITLSGPTPITTNSRGCRSTTEYVYQPEKFTILAVGDSFTFGAEVGDDDVWPVRLERLDPHYHVINLGVSGYGIDQMYLAIKETVADYRPQLVILAFIEEDFNRSMMSFRDYRKPRFVLEDDGSLALTNTPIGNERQTYAWLRGQYGRVCGKWRLWREDRAACPGFDSPAYEQQLRALNYRLIDEAKQETERHKAEFLLVRLAWSGVIDPQLGNPDLPDPGELLLQGYLKEHPVEYVETRRAFLEAGHPWAKVHYHRPEAEFVAGLIHAKIQAMRAWRDYLSAHPAQGANAGASGARNK